MLDTDPPRSRGLWIESPARPELEPNANPAARTFQEALLQHGIPITAFEVDDLGAEHRRLRERGVVFTREPTDAGPVRIAVLADTCGNLIQLHQERR